MFIVPIDAVAEPIRQVVPSVNVVVQQPPAGMPEWVKILITAVVGAVFGILSGPIAELVKTFVTRIPRRKMIRRQLIDELIENLDRAERACSEMLKKPKTTKEEIFECLGIGSAAVRELHDDQFEHYFTSDKDLVYEIDPERYMAEFYKRLKDSLEAVPDFDLDFVITSFKMAILLAIRFLRDNKINHTRQSTLYEEMAELAAQEAKNKK